MHYAQAGIFERAVRNNCMGQLGVCRRQSEGLACPIDETALAEQAGLFEVEVIPDGSKAVHLKGNTALSNHTFACIFMVSLRRFGNGRRISFWI